MRCVKTPLRVGPTSGSFGAGSLHAAAGVGLGPVDGPPPGGLAEAPGRRRQPQDGGRLRGRAAAVLEGVSALPGVGAHHGGGRLTPRRGDGGAGGGGGRGGGPGRGRRQREILDRWNCRRRRAAELLALQS